MTNFEKIKRMNEKELAYFMEDLLSYNINSISNSLVRAWESDGDERAKELFENGSNSEIIEYWLSKDWIMGDYYDQYDSEYYDEVYLEDDFEDDEEWG